MQGTSIRSSSGTDLGPAAGERCPVCGAPIRGIAATRPGEHRFVGCDHYASGRSLRSLDA